MHVTLHVHILLAQTTNTKNRICTPIMLKFINLTNLSVIKNILETPETQGHDISGDSLHNFTIIQNDLKKSNRSQLSVNNPLPAKFTLIRIFIQLVAQSKSFVALILNKLKCW